MWVNFGRPLKEEKNVGQFLAAEVTNPGQNESQQIFAFYDSSAEIGIKKISFEERCRREQMGWISCQTPGEETEPGFAGQ